jgi:hypothetical protein
MRAVLIVIAALALSGCWVPTAAVRSQAVSYDDAIEDTTNKLLVLNILRAKDKAPLHFDEIPSIHETIQATASVTAIYPFGPPLSNSSQPGRKSVAPGLNLQVSPSFEIDHLDTKDFVTGIASPIDPKFVKYWLDKGLDRRLVLLLFFSAADIVETDDNGVTHTVRIKNSPREAADTLAQQSRLGAEAMPDALRCDAQSEFQHYLRLIDSLRTFTAHSATERRLLAKNLTLDPKDDLKALETIAALDPAKFQWDRHADNTYSIFAVSAEPKTALCFADSTITLRGLPAQQDACLQSVVTVSSTDDRPLHSEEAPMGSPPIARRDQPSTYCTQFNRFLDSVNFTNAAKDSKPKPELRLEIRSVGEIIQFLGDLLEYQEQLGRFFREHPGANIKLNNPLTFGYCPDDKEGSAGCGDVFFNFRHDFCNIRFTLTYRNQRYSVPNYNPPDPSVLESLFCSSAEKETLVTEKDHTLEVLAVVHQLVDLQKSAQDIRETPYVQLLP